MIMMMMSKRWKVGVEQVQNGGKLKQTTINNTMKDREQVCWDISRFFYGCNVPFNMTKHPLFKKMLESVGNYGKGLKPPSYHEVRVTFLKKEVEAINDVELEKYRKEWKRTGCTLMSDGWTDGRSRSITNFLANSPSGTVFITSLDTSDISKNAKSMFELLDSMVMKIGEENVVQVVTDSASAYVSAGSMLQEKWKSLFWSPCAAHCINNMLKDIGELPVHKNTIEKARKITVFIYRHGWLLNLMRENTRGRELTRPGVTRFATNYLTLKSIFEQKLSLRAMFASEDWANSPYARRIEGMEVEDIVLKDKNFWKAIKYCLKCVLPLVRVLKLVDGDEKPAMGYIYEAMDRAKEKIEKNFEYVTKRYEDVWKTIDTRWELQLHRPLHGAALYLNPKFHYDEKYNMDAEVKLGFYKTMERMCSTTEMRMKVDEQLEKFKRAEGMFGLEIAILTRKTKQPALWWESYGDECKELQKVAIRILSLTCSATGCERNWSVFEHLHSKKRNRLEQLRLNDLVFVKYNLQLKTRQEGREKSGDTYAPISLSDMESDDEWITEKEEPCFLDPENDSWMDVHECFEVEGGPSQKKRKRRGPRNLNAIASRKGKGKKAIEIVDDEEEEFVESEEEEDEINEELVDDDSDQSIGDDDD